MDISFIISHLNVLQLLHCLSSSYVCQAMVLCGMSLVLVVNFALLMTWYL